MIRPRRSTPWAALIGATALLGCEVPREPLDLDVEHSCELRVTLVHDGLELSGPIRQFLGDQGGSSGGWALVSNPAQNGELELVRVPASASEAPTPVVELELADSDADAITMRAGTESGELWVLNRTGFSRLRRLLPELGEVARNNNITNFPIDDQGGDCPHAYERVLLMSEGQPLVLALPDCSDDQSLTLHLLSFEPDTLAFGTSWELAFDPCASYEDPVACAVAHAYQLVDVGHAGTSPLPDLERVPVGFVRVREFTNVAINGSLVHAIDVSLLDMRLTSEGPQARLLTFPEVWRNGTPIVLGDVALTQDPYSTQLFVRNVLLDDDAALLRFDTIGDLYIQLSAPELLPHLGHGQLVQLASQGAMVDVAGGRLDAVGLIDVDSWPWWEPTTLVEVDDLVGVEPAGVGMLLLRREDAAPQVIHVSCS